MNGAIVAAVISGLVSLAGIALNIGQQRRQAREARHEADLQVLAHHSGEAGAQLLALVNELQESLGTERRRLAELEETMDQVRRLYHQALRENDVLTEKARTNRIRIAELETRVEELERKQP